MRRPFFSLLEIGFCTCTLSLASEVVALLPTVTTTGGYRSVFLGHDLDCRAQTRHGVSSQVPSLASVARKENGDLDPKWLDGSGFSLTPKSIVGLLLSAHIVLSGFPLAAPGISDNAFVVPLTEETIQSRLIPFSGRSQSQSDVSSDAVLPIIPWKTRLALPHRDVTTLEDDQKSKEVKHVNWDRFVGSIFSSLLSVVFLSLLQAGVALFQYRTNPTGHLVIPTGPTVGVEFPNTDVNTTQELKAKEDTEFPSLPAWMEDVDSFWCRSCEEEELENALLQRENALLKRIGAQNISCSTTDNAEPDAPSLSARWIKRVNRFLVFLLPWLVQNFTSLCLKQAHLFHIGGILTIAKAWEISAGAIKWPKMVSPEEPPSTAEALEGGPTSHQPVQRVLVLGDSLAIGMGSINQFKVRPSDMPFFQLIENSNPTNFSEYIGMQENIDASPGCHISPVFPKSLAATLAQKQNCSVSWRSAGVDGGAVSHIREYCLPVLEQEIEKGHMPNCIVILCGMNDLKYQFAEHPWNFLSTLNFRTQLSELLQDIYRISSKNASSNNKVPLPRVIIPAMPTQMVLKNSAVGIFPLAAVLGALVGYWESQKKFVADLYHSKPLRLPVDYLAVSTAAVEKWYEVMEEEKGRHESFVSIDGIHPTSLCYSLWADYVSDYLTDTTCIRQVEEKALPIFDRVPSSLEKLPA